MSGHFKVVVIGAGPGGYVAALKAAQLGAQTAVIEKSFLGGTCLNNGCIPSKALLASAELLYRIKNSSGLSVVVDGNVSFNWSGIQSRKDRVLRRLRSGIQSLFSARKVALFTGVAELAGKGKVRITNGAGDAQIITADNIILAPGSSPARIPGWDDNPEYICTSDEALHWKELPGRVLIVGGGVIGCEFACMLNEFGVKVVVVEMMDQLLPEMDLQLGQAIEKVFRRRGIEIYTSVKVKDVSINQDSIRAVIGDGQTIEVDKILVAVGRMPNTEGLGLDSVGLETDRGFIKVNDRMETSIRGYYCVGDANGKALLAHAASAQGIVAAQNALGQVSEQNRPVPNAVYTFPEIASVGMTTQQVERENIPVNIGQFPIGYLGKSMAVGEEFGFVKVISHKEDGRLLGVHIIGHNATEIIETATAMLSLRACTKDLAEMIYAHPTFSEAMKEAAEDVFQSAIHLPPRKIT